MPHRVTNFLRTSSGNIGQIKKVAASRRSSPSPDMSDHEDNHHPYAVGAIKMPDLAEALKAHRLSLHFGKKEHSSAVALNWSMESPPIILHGNPEESTGALFSGQMHLEVKDEVVDVESFVATLKMHTTHKRPFQNHCYDCQNQFTELKAWNFLAHPMTLRRGTHSFPFSVLLEGHLPASMNTSTTIIAYEFKAEAKLNRTSSSQHPTTVKFERALPIKRAMAESEIPHHSVRLFPPTNIKSSAHYSTVIHPTGKNTVSLKLDGLMDLNEQTKTLNLWKLRKVTWKLEETVKTVSPACDKHRVGGEDEASKGAARTEMRVLGEKHLHDGWKSDYSGVDGTVDMEFDYQVTQRRSKGDLKYACSGKYRDGTEVTHSLLLELVVSKEYAPEGKPHMAAQTGTGRILRMHYDIIMSDHPGLGISWDNEAPPVYQDVPPSPPGYEFTEHLIEYDDLELLDAQRGSQPPTRRPSTSSD
ncbi:unnamed protein product [Clonostachys rosea]|uniref:LDB19 N-terminal domain-containing protein n=1 Tax=Bionectria ochroleuca TaxID=29856 RepID=A0ABY6UTR5_BIOOC|nr:unnamed protein product [Clonostachys rosea]